VVTILKTKGIKHVIKWVDDFTFICMPIHTLSPDATPVFCFDLDTILHITIPLGIPWNCIKNKGQDFAPVLDYCSFIGIYIYTLFHYLKRNVQKHLQS